MIDTPLLGQVSLHADRRTTRSGQVVHHAASRREIEAVSVRAAVYHALAESLAQPVSGVWERLRDAVTAGAQVLGSAACQEAVLALTQTGASSLQILRASYRRLIAGTDQRPVALYESLHRHGRLAGPITWQVEALYRGFGLAPIAGELPDHASVELAFLGNLAEAMVEASRTGAELLVDRLQEAFRAFLQTHVGIWLPEVGAALAGADGFYGVIGRLLVGFLAEEMKGQRPARRTGSRLPVLKNTAACTLCGLCVGSCPRGALRVIESATETALTLAPARCTGCDRCARACPEEILILTARRQVGSGKENGLQVMRQSPRAACPNCGAPTVSQAELEAVFTRLQADLATQYRLSLCIECKWVCLKRVTRQMSGADSCTVPELVEGPARASAERSPNSFLGTPDANHGACRRIP